MNFTKPQVKSIDTLHFVIGARIKALKNLAHEVLVETRHAWSLYQEAKETCRQIGAGSADRYYAVMEQLELARLGDQQAWRKVVEYLCPKAHAKWKAVYDRQKLLEETVRGSFPKRPDILYYARDRLYDIARKGGKEFDEALSLIKFAHVDAKTKVQAMELLFPDAARKLIVQSANTAK